MRSRITFGLIAVLVAAIAWDDTLQYPSETVSVVKLLGVAVGLACTKRAARPATCGEAMDVPLSDAVATSLVNHDEVMAWPGAKASRQPPKLENAARASVLVVAPTVMTSEVEAGEVPHASMLLFPAATAHVTP